MNHHRTGLVLAYVFATIGIAGLTIPSARAQTITGVITGTIVDASGAAVPGAPVTLLNPATGLRQSATSSASGDFVFPSVQPATYSVIVEAQGFKRYERKDIQVTAAERVNAGTMQLEVGALTESVTVSGEATPVQTTSNERSAMLDDQQMNKLMVRGRDYMGLLKTLPGVVPVSDSAVLQQQSAPNAVNGVRGWLTTQTVDGMVGNDPSSTNASFTPVSMDAVSEVKVLLTNYQAEYGRSAGAIINAVTKSGTSAFHGTLYDYLRNEDLNANEFFANRNGVHRPLYRYNVAGYTIGGPFAIPGKFTRFKDKIFFFIGQEFINLTQPGSLQQVTVPTTLERAGDFSQTLDVSGKQVPVKDPLNNGAQFPNNQIPLSRIDPNGQKLLQVFPLPNITDRSITKGNYNYNFLESLPGTRRFDTYRGDYYITDKLRLYYRENIFRRYDKGYATAASGPSWGLVYDYDKYDTEAGQLHATYTITPTLINEASFGYYHFQEPAGPYDSAAADVINRQKLGMTLGQFYPQYNQYGIIPSMSFGSSTIQNPANVSFDIRWPKLGATTLFTGTESITKIWGGHQIKAGFFAERDRMFKGNRGTNNGSFDFSRDVNNPYDANYAYGTALLGYFRTYTESTTRPGPDMRSTLLEWYIQDSWRVTKRLTLDYGLRITAYTPLWTPNLKAASFDPASYVASQAPLLFQPALNAQGVRSALNPLTGQYFPAVMIGLIVPNSGNTTNGMLVEGASGVNKGFVDNLSPLYAPRIGFAYDLFGDGKTAIRGGIGFFYSPIIPGTDIGSSGTYAVQANPPFQYNPVEYYGSMSTFLSNQGVIAPTSVCGIIPSKINQTTYNYSIGIQRDIGFKTVVDVAYVGALGRHLLQSVNLNTIPYGAHFTRIDPTTNTALADNFDRPYPGYATINEYEANGNSSYHSLQVQANRRFARGLQFGATWTWSKFMDDTDNDQQSISLYVNPNVWNYGKSLGYDHTHILSINFLYDIPKPSKLLNAGVIRAAFDNWELSGVASYIDGSPMGISYSLINGADVTGGGDGSRVVVLSNAVLPKGQRTLYQYFNTSAFAAPTVGTIGNAPKDVFRGPGIANWDLSFFKNFPIKDKATFQFRWELYNALNHPSFQGVNTSASFSAPGSTTQLNGQFGQVTSTNGQPRVMQASLRVTF